MKKLLTLCLALAMTLSVGAYALTTLGRNRNFGHVDR